MLDSMEIMHPILLRLGPVTIYSFGVAMAIAVLAGSFLVWRQSRKRGLSEEKVLDILFLTIILSLIFGRAGFVYAHWSVFSLDWSRILLVGKYPGLSFLTSLISGVAISGLLAKNSAMPATLIWDVFFLAMTFALIPGLFGCFLDGCVADTPTYLILVLAVAAAAWWLGMMGLSKLLSSRAELSEMSKQHGLFFLGYLIFQTVSLLMLTSAISNQSQVWAYWSILILALLVFVGRYWKLFSYVYDSISKKRSVPDQSIS